MSPATDYDVRHRLGATAIARHSASAERAFAGCWKSAGDRWSPIYHSERIASSTARHRDARTNGGVVLDFDLRGWAGVLCLAASAMTTLVTVLEALIVSMTILYATYCLVHLGICCVRWAVHSIGPHPLKRAGRPHPRR
jgi:hypothetical protein